MSDDAIGGLSVDVTSEDGLDLLAEMHSDYNLVVDGVFWDGEVTFEIHPQ